MAARTRLTPKKRAKFLQCLIDTGNVSRAAASIGISRTRMYELKKEDEAFAQAWDEAVDIGIDHLEEEARRRAYQGTDKPVFYQGYQCGTIREYSDTLMIFLLKAHRPDKFKERVVNEHTGEGGGPIRRVDMTAEEFRQIAGDLVKDV